MTAQILPFAKPDLPNSVEAEADLLGALLVSNDLLDKVGYLKPEHFYFEAHAKIFAAIVAAIRQGKAATVNTLSRHFATDPDFVSWGGGNYLGHLAAETGVLGSIEPHARGIVDLAMRRRMIEVGLAMVADAKSAETTASAREMLEQHETALHAVSDTADDDGALRPFSVALNTALENANLAAKGGNVGLPTGLSDLDGLLSIVPGQLVLLAGRPSMGKSALAWSISLHVANKGQGVAFLSLEMGAEQLAQRALADMTNVPFESQQRGALSDNDFSRLVQAAEQMQSIPLYIKDSGSRTVAGIRSEIRRIMRQRPISLVVIDYLQLMRPENTYRGNKVNEVGEISAALKSMARDLNVPVLALSQLSRALESREDKRPMLSDLRDSGALEQDADAVMFVYREEYYLSRTEPTPGDAEWGAWKNSFDKVKNLCEVIVAKNRQGPIGKKEVFFDAATNRFRDLRQ